MPLQLGSAADSMNGPTFELSNGTKVVPTLGATLKKLVSYSICFLFSSVFRLSHYFILPQIAPSSGKKTLDI